MRRATAVARGNVRGAAVVGDGLNGTALCNNLFGAFVSETYGAACVRFRCRPPRDAEVVVL